MKRVAFILLFFAHSVLFAQIFKAEISYSYFYSNKWDKAIQTYNFSRPFISEKQPLLAHGLSSSFGYIFNSSSALKQGMNISYSNFSSNAENENFNNTLSLHFLRLGYLLHYSCKGKLQQFYTELTLSVATSGLFRSVNGAAIQSEETPIKALGIGPNLDLKLGYNLLSKNRFSISPYAAIAYNPFFYSPNAEAVINQTIGLTADTWTGFLMAQLGFSFHLKKQ